MTGYTTKEIDGDKFWLLDDKFHREDGPAFEGADGIKIWYINGQRHRVNGPAIELANGAKYWYQNDALHREDGPAIEFANGTKEWYLNDKRLTEKKFKQITKKVDTPSTSAILHPQRQTTGERK